jgi:succinyl-diaminopimelate desuccinylase
VQRLGEARLAGESGPAFPLSPSLTVTAIQGGEGFTTIPDLCRLQVDMRLTPAFGAEEARDLLTGHASAIDREQPSPLDTRVEELDTWPAYRLAKDSPLAGALVDAARRHVDPSLEARVGGPSNIGNLCAAHGVPATCGFGVGFEGIHAADETALVADVPVVYRTYRDAVTALLLPVA